MAEPHKTPTVEDEADDGAAAEENEEDWEDEESEEEEDAEDDDESEGEDEGDEEIDHEDVHELAMKTNALLVALFLEPSLNRTDPLLSPKPLLNTIDFVRQTYTSFIMPLLPALATQKCPELFNPFVPQDVLPPDPSILEAEHFPELDMAKYEEAVGRNLLICTAIIEPGTGERVVGGRFDWGDHVREVAGMIAGGIEAEEQVREKYAAKGIDLSKGQDDSKEG